MLERLQKIIARAGISSRRAAEELVSSGRVRVNGVVVTELGTKADPYNDKIEVDGRRLVAEDLVYVVLHKPRNVVATMSDPEGRPSVAEYLKHVGGRVYPVGRLDFGTSGVLLATNDGEFANGLLHPRKDVPKTYIIKALGVMSDADLDVWRKGAMLEDGKTLPTEVRFLRHEGDKTWFEMTLREGRNQQIRRMGDATGFRVGRLARLSFAGITSDELRPGEWRHLTKDELIALREAYGVPKRVRAGSGSGGAPPSKLAPRVSATAAVRAARATIGAARPSGPNPRGAKGIAAAAGAAAAAASRTSSATGRPTRSAGASARAEAGRASQAPHRDDEVRTTHDRTSATPGRRQPASATSSRPATTAPARKRSSKPQRIR